MHPNIRPEMKNKIFKELWIYFLMVVLVTACRQKTSTLNENIIDGTGFLKDTVITGSFPEFITPTVSFYLLTNNGIPEINENNYQLKVHGAINLEKSFTLKELRDRKLINKTVTFECIGNNPIGKLYGNAMWTGFSIYDLISELGLKSGAYAVKYTCQDGYFMTNTISELSNSNIIGALYMNMETLPVKYGFPLKIIYPGYHGVRQPGWVTDIEVLYTEPADYWSGSFWKAKSPIGVTSKLFYPMEQTIIQLGKTIQIAGAAYGSRRISEVQLTMDNGISWNSADIIKKSTEDYVWVFWRYNFTPAATGNYFVKVRATDTEGNVQIENDNDLSDGYNSWPSVVISVGK